jgi:hypothetical protein
MAGYSTWLAIQPGWLLKQPYSDILIREVEVGADKQW